MKRREFSKATKAAMYRRATKNGVTRCEGCGLAVTTWEFDHTIAEALFLDKTHKLTSADGQLLGACCHRGPDGKTAEDVAKIAKAKRVEARNAGIKRPKQTIRSAGFPKSEKQRIGKPSLPPRNLFMKGET